MDKKKNTRRKKSKKKNKPRVRFNFGVILTMIFLSFVISFALYMAAANFNEDFIQSEFGVTSSSSQPDVSSKSSTPSNEAAPPDNENGSEDTGVNPVPQSASPADASYLSNCCLITDKTLLNMKGFGDNSVFGSETMTIANSMSEKVESSFGTLSPYDIVKQKKPQILYIMLGSELGTVPVEEMIASYSKLVSGISSAVSDIKIYVMQYPPVLYDTDSLSNEAVNDYNAKLIEMCNNNGIYCIDTNTALKAEDGRLNEEYWSYETLTLSQYGYDKIEDYILTHVAD